MEFGCFCIRSLFPDNRVVNFMDIVKDEHLVSFLVGYTWPFIMLKRVVLFLCEEEFMRIALLLFRIDRHICRLT